MATGGESVVVKRRSWSHGQKSMVLVCVRACLLSRTHVSQHHKHDAIIINRKTLFPFGAIWFRGEAPK